MFNGAFPSFDDDDDDDSINCTPTPPQPYQSFKITITITPLINTETEYILITNKQSTYLPTIHIHIRIHIQLLITKIKVIHSLIKRCKKLILESLYIRKKKKKDNWWRSVLITQHLINFFLSKTKPPPSTFKTNCQLFQAQINIFAYCRHHIIYTIFNKSTNFI